MGRWDTLPLAIVAFVAWIGGAVCARGVAPVYPGRQWATQPPEEAGLRADQLEAFREYVGGFGCVVRHGYLVYTWGDAARRMDVASAAKPVYACFLFKAVEDGRIAGFDEPVCRWEPRLKDINAKLEHKDARITWRHMANQVSCYGLAEPPGTAFAYNDWQMALLFDTLFTKVYGATYQNVDGQVLHAQLTDLIGCEDNPTFMAFGVDNRPGRLAISPRDFARFGLLYLRGGKWRGKQLLRPEHARMAVTEPVPNSIPRAGQAAAEMIPGQRTLGSQQIPDNQTDHLGSYSWLWWINGVDREGKRHWPDAPVDAYGCFGHGGIRAMIILPGLDLIVSWNDTRVDAREKENQALKLLVAAVSVRPGN
jgi:CubicO group peptidase (beta-lactamase class C family)